MKCPLCLHHKQLHEKLARTCSIASETGWT